MKKQHTYILLSLLVLCFGIIGLRAQTPTPVDAQWDNDTIATHDTLAVRVKQYKQETMDDLNAVYPIDLADPENIETVTEYDHATGAYIIHTRVGDVDIATPFVMTETEYRSYEAERAMLQYWKEKNNTGERNNEQKFNITDMKFDIGPADKVFGPGGVQLKMQGSAELIFGFKHTKIDNPALTERNRTNNVFDFDEKIQVNVTGKVGDKINFNLGYNTEASFDFDQTKVKLAYKGKEDDIIKNLEAGNVSMQLNSSLISGGSALFGVKTDLQFGKLSVQAIATQQNSETQTVSSEGGAQLTDYEIAIDEYDENRHFFLSHYFRSRYDQAMATLPHVTSGVTINRIEVWVTNKRGNYEQARNILAFMDLGETKAESIDNSHWTPTGAQVTPSNKANTLYDEVTALDGIRDIQRMNDVMATNYSALDINGGEDYEKIESARLLTQGEYTLNKDLGYISLRSMLNPDEVLAVAFEYTYKGEVYQVGEFSTDQVVGAANSAGQTPALMLKLLKSTTQSPQLKLWDLMMKNIYSLGSMQMQQEKFELNIMYRNDSVGTELQYISEGNIKGKQLLRVMNLDRLDKKENARADGVFDYVEGFTAISSTGRIIFPVLEPFGEHLRKAIGNDAIAANYIFPELYDSTLVIAQELSEKNKFTLKGKYKGTSGAEIRLNAMNVPRGSVTVTAGGATLRENVDYTVDYTMGVVNILNQSIIESGTKVDVKLENQSMFSMQRKSLFGTHLEYAFSDDLAVGATVMHLSEMPLTTKVNTGSEPLSNTIWGANLAWKTESQWLTNTIAKVPWITATQPSNLSVNAEFAQLIPGHSKAISHEGLAYLDDFESTKTSIDIHYPYSWYLSSTPGMFNESALSNDIDYGKNRALLSWYMIDPMFVVPQNGVTPMHIINNIEEIKSDHRVRAVEESEIYPNKDLLTTQSSRISTLNLSYYPQQRGPYNLDVDGMNADGTLQNPADRWGGMMRKLDNTDFETANIEYIEFWLMDPALTNEQSPGTSGYIYFNLGDISEDILKDGKKSFEHGLPTQGGVEGTEETVWGRVSKTQSTVSAFSNAAGARQNQDVGIDGLKNDEEFLFPAYGSYVQALKNKLDAATKAKMENDPFSPLNDPAGDNFHYYRGSDFDQEEKSILDRYMYFNGTEGNSADASQSTENYGTSSTLLPDMEDINSDNTLNEYEKYYQYRVAIDPNNMEVGSNYITDRITANVTLGNGKKEDVDWYQFKIPIREFEDRIGSIRNFKSIRFIRMFLTGFTQETHLRMATLDLVRGEWRGYTKNTLYDIQRPPATNGQLDIQAVNIEENSKKTPVNYVLPPGVTRQTDPGQSQMLRQNEQAMVMRVKDLAPGDARAVYKNTTYDMRNYKRLQMFVHAEEMLDDMDGLEDYQLSCFIRLGSDMVNNYYEYEIPLQLTEHGLYSGELTSDREAVWPESNLFDFAFDQLIDTKLKRNQAIHNGMSGVSNATPYTLADEEKPMNNITVMGNPSIAEVENIMIGVRNNSGEVLDGEIWVNELRMSEFDEEGGWAAMANMALSLSDIAQVNVAGRVETAGFGGIESNVLDRRMDDLYQLNLSTAVEVGRLFPEKAKLQIPLYFSYTNETLSPKYNPLDTDVELKEALAQEDTKAGKDSIRSMSQTVVTSKSFNISNAKVNIKSKKKPMFYDPANLSLTYAMTENNEQDAEIEKNVTKTQRGAINYSYSFNPKPWEPFKKNKKLNKPAYKLIKEFNIYYLPQSFSASTDMFRTFNQLKLRDFNIADSDINANEAMDLTFSQDFVWNRQFDAKWDLTKTLKFSLQTGMNANIDEGYFTPELDMGKDVYEAWRDTVWNSIAQFGSPQHYQQVFTASWNVPLNKIPFLDWVTANGSYNSNYDWNRTASMEGGIDYGNVISSMGAWQADGQLNFEKLYDKSKYLKSVNQRYSSRSRGAQRPFRSRTFTQMLTSDAGEEKTINHRLGSTKLRVTAKDKNGKPVAIKYTAKNSSSMTLTSKVAMDSVLLSIESIDPNLRTPAQKALDMTARFLMLIRKVSVTYRQTNSMVVPGFYPKAGFMGQNYGSDVHAPGFDFSFGFIPKDFIDQAVVNDWLAINDSVVNPATSANTTDFDIKVNLEPLPGLKIDLNGKRYMANSNSIQYMYEGMPTTFTGSFNITQVAIGTAFRGIGSAEKNFVSETFDTFLENRDVMAGRLQKDYANTMYPTTGFMQNHPSSGQAYNPNLGTVNRNSADVLIPAFLAAYTGRDINRVNKNPFLGILDILPNWRVSYDGLSRIPWIKENFKSVTLNHAYDCRYNIGSYTSYSTWAGNNPQDATMGFVRDVQTNNPIPSSAYDISSVALTEQFSPLIGVNIAMKNSLTTKVEYRKQRNLALNVSSTQMVEGHSDEFVIGAGYTIKDFDVILKLKSDKQKRMQNDLKISADISYRDVKSLLRKLDDNVTQATSGNKVFALKVMADYTFSRMLNFQVFYDQQSTTPLISSSFPISTSHFGVSIKFMLTR